LYHKIKPTVLTVKTIYEFTEMQQIAGQLNSFVY